MFEGERIERGFNPLSLILPSSAMRTCGYSPAILAGEGIKG